MSETVMAFRMRDMADKLLILPMPLRDVIDLLREGADEIDRYFSDMQKATEQREPAAWLDPDAGKAITAAEKEAADTRQARWQHSYTVPLYR